ncbi:PTS transporter subunit EIIB [Photobacterium damselae subsp. piscicida]|nr:PTS transporter subunit EIIB [Photobacterium damselae subsp. piscicida]
MIEALGGKDNIEDVGACITRLRITVKNGDLVKDNQYWTQELGAKGLVKVGGTGIQAIYGAQAAGYKAQINSKLGK